MAQPLKLCVLVKEVPEPGAGAQVESASGRLDRSGASVMNPFDAHALEAAVRLRELAPESPVGQIVAVTMGPPSAAAVLRRAISLGADRGVHLSDPALAGACTLATGYALARVLEREQPDLVLCGQQSADGECYAMAAILGEELRMPSLTQVSRLELIGDILCCERQIESGPETLELDLPAVVSVTDGLNEPRYRSLRALAAARELPLETLSAAAAGIEPERAGERGSGTAVLYVEPPPSLPVAEMVDGADPEVAAERIVAWLAARGLL